MAVLPKAKETSSSSSLGSRFGGSEETRFIFKMMSPTLIIFVIGILFEVIYAFVLSFYYTDRVRRIDEFNGIGTYLDIFADPRFWNAYFNTILITVVTVTIELLLGLSIALVINKKFKGRGIVRAAILIPWAMPTIVNAQLWVFMFRATSTGLFNNILFSLGLIPKVDYPLVNANKYIPLNILGLVLFPVMIVTFIVVVYNWGKLLINKKTNEITQDKKMIVIFVIFLLSFILLILLPIIIPFDKMYSHGGWFSAFTVTFPFDFFAVFLVDIWKTTPFMALLILASLQTVPDDLYKAAQVDGATSWQ